MNHTLELNMIYGYIRYFICVRFRNVKCLCVGNFAKHLTYVVRNLNVIRSMLYVCVYVSLLF